MAPGLFKALTAVAKADKSSTVSLQLHTNATVWNPDYLNTLTKYKHVKIGISIDSDVTSQLEYIRYPVEADVVWQNLSRYKDWASNHSNIELYICVTLTPLNIFYFDSIYKNLRRHSLSVGHNIVYSPIEYDVRHIPVPVRKIIAEKLKHYPTLVNFLMQTIPGCDVAWPKFWKITKELDSIRNQSFESTFPEFYELIKTYV